jgi:hypothetical protein
MSRDPEDPDDETTFFDIPIKSNNVRTPPNGSNPRIPHQSQASHNNPNAQPAHLQYTNQNQWQNPHAGNHQHNQYSQRNQQQQYQQQQQQYQQQQQQYQQQQQQYQQQQQQYQQQQYQQYQRQQQYQQQQYQRQQQQQNIRHQYPQQKSRQIPPSHLKTPRKKALKDMMHHLTMLLMFIGLTAFSITMGFLLLGISVSDLMKPIQKYEIPTFDWSEKKKDKLAKNEQVVEINDDVIDEDYIQPSPPLQSKNKRLIADNARVTVHNNLRSGKIDSLEQLKFMRDEYGIKRVINLAYDSTFKQTGPNCGRARGRMCERIWAKELELEFYYLPLTDKGPKDEDWETIKELMLLGDNLVHCTHGADRTGAVIGRFRLELQPMVTKEEILEEALKYGFKPQNFRYKGGKLDPNRHLRRWMLGGER